MSFPVLNIAEQLSLSGGTLLTDCDGGTLHLATGMVPPPSRDSIASDFTEAVYPGYAASTVAIWDGPYKDANGDYIIVMPAQIFVGPVGGGGPVITGAWYQAAGSAGHLIWATLLDTPAPLSDQTDVLVLTGQIGPLGQGWISQSGSTIV